MMNSSQSLAAIMATITIRNLDDKLKARLRLVAAQHGHSMEEETRTILRQSLTRRPVESGLGSRIHRCVVAAGGADLETPERTEMPRGADFEA